MGLSYIIPVLIGAGVTWLAAWLYYKKAGNELRQETAKLRRLTTLVLHSLEEASLVKLRRDESGKIIGLVIYGSAKLIGEGLVSGKGEVIRPEAENEV